MQVVQIGQRGLGEVVVRQVQIHDLRRHHRLHARRQRRVPHGQRLVVVHVADLLLRGERVAPQVHRHHEVRLLHDLLPVQVEVRIVQQQRVFDAGVPSKSHRACSVNRSDCGCTPSILSNGSTIFAAASRRAASSSAVTPNDEAASGCRSQTAAASSRFRCAIRLLSTTAEYSSGPVTPSIRNPPCTSWCPSDDHSRAVSTRISVACSRSKSSSSVAARYRATASDTSADTWNAPVPAGQYAEHSAPSIERHGNAAPRNPSAAARSRAAGRVACRHRSASRAASGTVYVSTGSTNVSLSQKECPSYPGPVRPFAGIALLSPRDPACSTWNSANRTACCNSSSPSISTSAVAQKSSRYARCSSSRPCQPVCLAPAIAADTCDRSAGADRRDDQP